MLAFALVWIVSQTPGIQVQLTGVAKNAKGGAVLLVNGAPVYIEHLAEWPAGIVDTQLAASGELVDFAYLPQSTTSENGEVSQGTQAGATQRVLRRAQWKSLAPPPPTGITLRPTQRVGALLAGVTVVLAGVAVGVGLSANVDAKALKTLPDAAREVRMRDKTIATGILAGFAGASLIAAIVLLALPPDKLTVVPAVNATSSGATVGFITWF